MQRERARARARARGRRKCARARAKENFESLRGAHGQGRDCEDDLEYLKKLVAEKGQGHTLAVHTLALHYHTAHAVHTHTHWACPVLGRERREYRG